jgi:large subunit ribosomal protein L18Ae
LAFAQRTWRGRALSGSAPLIALLRGEYPSTLRFLLSVLSLPWALLNWSMPFKQYVVVGRRLPEQQLVKGAVDDTLYKMVIYAPDPVKAKSKYYYFLSQLLKTKRSTAEVVAITEVKERDTTRVKNYTIWLRYRSRTGQVNMLKETRATSVAGAVENIYQEMAGRHRARAESIQILRVQETPSSQCKRPATLQLIDPQLRFPLPRQRQRASKQSLRTTFKAKLPVTTITK